MRIVLVVDMFDEENNGTTMTARRFADMLRQRGHQVRVVSIGESGKDKFGVPEAHYKLVTRISHKQGFVLPLLMKRCLERHLREPILFTFSFRFHLNAKRLKLRDKWEFLHRQHFILQPENITYNIHCEKVELLSIGCYRLAHRYFIKILTIFTVRQNLLRENYVKMVINKNYM